MAVALEGHRPIRTGPKAGLGSTLLADRREGDLIGRSRGQGSPQVSSYLTTNLEIFQHFISALTLLEGLPKYQPWFSVPSLPVPPSALEPQALIAGEMSVLLTAYSYSCHRSVS